jgi:serine/threonine protein kinase/outer membrane biosynthesis protein TonB
VRPSSDSSGKRSAGRYVLGELLGRGGMAEVFAGHSIGDHGFQKPVAIKRLLPELATDQVFVARLIEEAKLLVGMSHGNIVSVIDLARDGDDVFLVMEFVDGPSLRQLLKTRGSRGLSLAIATYVVQTAAAGLEFAHARPGGAIVHADISPSNLLLTTSGEVKVADFGIARREGGACGVVEGKWAYMAPEQARGEPLTARSDVFALGVVLYELICGAHPFGRQVTHEERDSEPLRVIPPRVVKPSIPHGLDAIVMRALAHDPRDRYSRMQHLIDALVEERFANQWREGASDLAQAIRECQPGGSAYAPPRTMVTDRPVTIMTRSLLRELTPARRSMVAFGGQCPPNPPHMAAAVAAVEPPSERDEASSHPSVAAVPESGAQTNALADEIRRAAEMLALSPAGLRADGTPLPPFRFADVPQPKQDLASVVGGHTMTGAQAGAVPVLEPTRGTRWTITILGVGALIGVFAAVVMQFRKDARDADDRPAQVAINDKATEQGNTGSSGTDWRDLTKEIPPAKQPTAPEQAPAQATAPQPEQPQPEQAQQQQVQPPAEQTPAAPAPAPTAPEQAAPAQPDDKDDKDDKTDVPDRPRPSRPAAPKKQEKEKQEPGFVRVSTNPWSYAMVGEQRVDSTWRKLTLQPGTYTIRIECGGCARKRVTMKTVTVRSQKTSSITFDWDEEE